MKKCPYCAEEIQDAAIVCKHCGRDLVPQRQANHKKGIIPAWRQGLKIGFVMAILSGCYSFVKYSGSDPNLLVGSLVVNPIAAFIGWSIVGTIVVWIWRQLSGNYEMGYQQEQRNKTNTQSEKSDFKSEQGKDTREYTPIKVKNGLTALWVVLGSVGVILCASLIVFSLNNPLSDRSNLQTIPVSYTSTNQLIPYFDDMILIPGGEFTMGRNDGAPNEAPAHLVNLSDFYIDKYEVTNSMYGKCVDTGFCEPPTRSDSPSSPSYFGNPEFESYPVIYITWDMASAFCKWREARLPTEAEWERAARGNDARLYPWGNEFTDGRSNFCDINCLREWKNKDYNDGYPDTAPVGSFPQGQSPYGVFDMSGNVYEWVADWSYLESGQDRVIRGGAWSDVSATNATSRATFSLSSAYEFIGFRCARSIVGD